MTTTDPTREANWKFFFVSVKISSGWLATRSPQVMIAKRFLHKQQVRRITPSWSSSLNLCRFYASVEEDHEADNFMFEVVDASRLGGPQQERSNGVSRVREQAAHQRLTGMTQLVQELSLPPSQRATNPSTPSLHQAVLYWLSKPARAVFCRHRGSDRLAAQNALSIVLWTEQNRRSELFRVADIPTLARLVRMLLSFSRKSDMEQQLEGLYQASQLMQLMLTEIVTTTNRSNEESCMLALALLWNRRIKFLTSNQHHSAVWHDDHRATVALGAKVDAKKCLEELQRICARISEMNPSTLSIYWSLLSSLAHLGSGQEALNVLQQLERIQAASTTSHAAKEPLELSISFYNAVLMAFSNQASASMNSEEREACRQTAWLVWEDHVCRNSHLNRYHPVTMTVLLKLLAQDNPQRAQEFLESIPNPTAVQYNVVLSAWAKARQKDASSRALSVLRRMQTRQVVPDHISYTAVMETLLRSNDFSALDQVDELLRHCQSASSSTEAATGIAGPDAAMYIVMLRGLLSFHRRHVESLIKEEICRRMDVVLEQMTRLDTKAELSVNVETYKLVLDAWSTSHSPLAATRAMELLVRMEAHSIAPDVEALQLVLRCLSVKVVDPKRSREQAEAVFQRLEQYQLPESPEIFQQYLRTLARTGNVEDAQHLMTQRLERGMPPDEACYFAIIEGYAKLPNGASLADELLQKWDGPPSLRMLATVMTSWAHHKDDSARAIQRVDELWQQAVQLRGNELPSYFYGTYMKALNKRLNSPVLMEQLLMHMKKEYESGNRIAKPNASNFAAVITAWAESELDGAAERAEAILHLLEDLNRHGVEFKPTLQCYRGVIMGWALSNDLAQCGKRAVAVLDRLEQQAAMQPNRSCFHYAIKAVGKSDDENKAKVAFQLLQRMKRSYASGNRCAQPTVYDYVTTIRAIGSSKGSWEARSKAYKLVEQVLMDWQKSFAKASLQYQKQFYQQYLWAAGTMLEDNSSRNLLVSRALQGCSSQLLEQSELKQTLLKVISLPTYLGLVSRKTGGAP